MRSFWQPEPATLLLPCAPAAACPALWPSLRPEDPFRRHRDSGREGWSWSISPNGALKGFVQKPPFPLPSESWSAQRAE